MSRQLETSAPGWGGTIAAMAAVVFVVVLLVVSGTTGSEEPVPTTVSGGALQRGDCLESVTGTQVVPCARSHAGEVFDVYGLPAASYTDEEVNRVAAARCADQLWRYLGLPAAGTTGYAATHVRTASRLACVLHLASGRPLQGSVRGRGRHLGN